MEATCGIHHRDVVAWKSGNYVCYGTNLPSNAKVTMESYALQHNWTTPFITEYNLKHNKKNEGREKQKEENNTDTTTTSGRRRRQQSLQHITSVNILMPCVYP